MSVAVFFLRQFSAMFCLIMHNKITSDIQTFLIADSLIRCKKISYLSIDFRLALPVCFLDFIIPASVRPCPVILFDYLVILGTMENLSCICIRIYASSIQIHTYHTIIYIPDDHRKSHLHKSLRDIGKCKIIDQDCYDSIRQNRIIKIKVKNLI